MLRGIEQVVRELMSEGDPHHLDQDVIPLLTREREELPGPHTCRLGKGFGGTQPQANVGRRVMAREQGFPEYRLCGAPGWRMLTARDDDSHGIGADGGGALDGDAVGLPDAAVQSDHGAEIRLAHARLVVDVQADGTGAGRLARAVDARW